MKVWTFQDPRQRKEQGEDAPWFAGWLDPDGKRKSKKAGTMKQAERLAGEIAKELREGTYRFENKKRWEDFRMEWEARIMPGLAPSTQETARISLKHFERIVKPGKVSTIKTTHIDQYVAVRRTEPGQRQNSTSSPATINRELRHLKAILNVAVEWRYLAEMPKFRMQQECLKEPRYITAERFAAIYKSCESATRPMGAHFRPADWWRALIVTAYMTGWRIREILALRRQNLDLEKGVAVLAASETKGKRGERVPLHPIVIAHLSRIISFQPTVFHIKGDRRMLWTEFHRIQKDAGIDLPCDGDHEHTDACHRYGFHDLRRAFATLNAERLTPDALQSLMRHKAYTTTQRYIAMSQQLNRAVDNLHVPECLRKAN